MIDYGNLRKLSFLGVIQIGRPMFHADKRAKLTTVRVAKWGSGNIGKW